ncbi:hypothetical protein FSPOR_11240 [Fusarium sporotrichioides]|uniref:Uncharacterized protein n=1 Tax=Fusarium sporotrichioides TaxID=5514 RepID=A0A395RHE9_FUSSP|nr:hypothetical protein FSPOR_11240 [Fusarium sporotrichioides]
MQLTKPTAPPLSPGPFHPFLSPSRRQSNISDVPTSRLSAVLKDPYLVEKKHNDIASKIPTDPETRRVMMQQCMENTPQLVTLLKKHFEGLDISDPEPRSKETDQKLKDDIVADQKELDYATERYREAAEAFHYWDTGVWKIYAKMRTRERLAEVKEE